MLAGFAAVLLLSLVAVSSAAAQVVVEDWTKIPAGTKGVPPGWKTQSWGSPKYDWVIVNDENRPALHMKSANEGSLASSEVKGKVNIKDTPIIEWSWKAVKGKTYCYDLHATILHLLGIDHEKLTFRHNGIDRRLTDVHGEVIEEILT